MIAARLL